MTYYLGRDVVVAITTEDAHFGIGLDGGDTGGLSVLDMTGSGAAGAPDVTTADINRTIDFYYTIYPPPPPVTLISIGVPPPPEPKKATLMSAPGN